MKIRICSINISSQPGFSRQAVDEAYITAEGIIGDTRGGRNQGQISLLSKKSISPLAPGSCGENLTIEGIDPYGFSLLDHLKIGEVELEIIRIPRTGSISNDICKKEEAESILPHRGIFARVISGGKLRKGEEIIHIPRLLKIMVLTVSDRAFTGEYEDRSGPHILTFLRKHFAPTTWKLNLSSRIIPDDVQMIRSILTDSILKETDIIFTTGGTGIGPKDYTVDTVLHISDRIVPGVMDSIRIKYGSDNPNALLSRSVCALKGETIIYTLPGSTRAVDEYLREIIKTMEHMILMLHGIGH